MDISLFWQYYLIFITLLSDTWTELPKTNVTVKVPLQGAVSTSWQKSELCLIVINAHNPSVSVMLFPEKICKDFKICLPTFF